MSDAPSRLSAALEGRYAVERLLGEGGMATVYLATDVRHNRRVALKVLRPELAAVVGAARFLAEIETTAKLQHPHILPLFDSGEAGGLLFYVMPHVEGETLRDRLDRERQLPVDQAVAIATDVAEALEYAHKRGVIHRDIKPANILLQDGKALVSDFGIALALNAGGAGRLTETGLSLGTPHYMSPEQATGDMSVGAATDIYALGCVLYEMLVGEPPYTGSTPQAVLGKIIAGEMPSATKQRTTVPAHVDATIRKALERVPADRFASAGELARALGDGAFRRGKGEGTGLAGGGVSRGRATALALGGAVVGAVLMALFTGREPSTSTAGVMRFPLIATGEVLRRSPPHPDLSISPDGRVVAYEGVSPGTGEQLFLRTMDEVASIPLAGVGAAVSPSFSPDGRWIAFVDGTAQATLKRVAVTGGAVETLAVLDSVGYIAGVTWEDPDHLIVGTGASTGLYRVTVGGVVELLVRGQYHWPTYVQGRDAVVFLDHADGQLHLAALDLRTGEVSSLGVQGTAPRFLSSGHLVYTTPEGRLAGARFDSRTLALIGEPVTLPEVVDLKANEGAANFDVSSDGTLIFIPGGTGNGQSARLMRIARDGTGSLVASIDGDVAYPRVSPDGSRVAMAIGVDLWALDLLRGARTRVTFGGVNRFLPVWTADGSRLTHADGTDVQNRVLLTVADGSGRQDTLIALGPRAFPTSWSPDGRTLAFTVGGQDNRPRDIHTLLRDGARSEVASLVETEFNERGAVFSPNGRWVAYVSDKSGRDEIYVRALDGAGAEVTVSLEGGREPVWSRSGSELFFRGSSAFFAVSVEMGAQGPNVGQPRALFPDAYRRDVSASAGSYANYDVLPNGDLLVVAEPEAQESATIHIAVNWLSELRERLPN